MFRTKSRKRILIKMAFPKGLKQASELAKDKEHGTRIKYKAGCKCLLCRAANSRYESERIKARKNGEWNGLVSAKNAREHILYLSRFGIGYKTVADVAGITTSTIFKIRQGKRKQLRAENEKAILAIDETALPDSAIIPAKTTWVQIRWLLREGFTEKELATRLGYKNGVLQIGKERVTAKTAMKIEKFYNSIKLGGEEDNYDDNLEKFLTKD